MAILQRLVDDDIGQLVDKAVVFRQRDKHAGGDQPVFRMLPAGQRLHPHPLAGRKADLGLIPGQQLIVVEGAFELVHREDEAIVLARGGRLGCPGVDQLAQPLRAGGFLDATQHMETIGRAHAQHGLHHVIFQRAGEDDAAPKATQREAAQQRHAIHAGHPQIAEQDVDSVALAQRQGFDAVCGLQQLLITERPDLVHQGLALKTVILDHHDDQLVCRSTHRATIPFHVQ